MATQLTRAAIRVAVSPRMPAAIWGTSGVSVDRLPGGTFVVGSSYEGLEQVSAAEATQDGMVKVYREATRDYVAVRINEIEGSGGGGQQGFASYIAVEALSGDRVVRAVDGGVRYASADDVSQAGTVVGITMHGADAGMPVIVRQSGEIDNSSWTWPVQFTLFLGVNGGLTTTMPTTGFVQPIATALSPTRIFVSIGDPIILA